MCIVGGGIIVLVLFVLAERTGWNFFKKFFFSESSPENITLFQPGTSLSTHYPLNPKFKFLKNLRQSSGKERNHINWKEEEGRNKYKSIVTRNNELVLEGKDSHSVNVFIDSTNINLLIQQILTACLCQVGFRDRAMNKIVKGSTSVEEIVIN